MKVGATLKTSQTSHYLACSETSETELKLKKAKALETMKASDYERSIQTDCMWQPAAEFR